MRVLAATNQPLDGAVQHGRFRNDLMYRLKILHLELPPLRDRIGDAERLAEHFVRVLCSRYGLPLKRFDDATLAWMRSYRWPGNVRELENWVHRQLLMADDLTIRAMLGTDGDTDTDDAVQTAQPFAIATVPTATGRTATRQQPASTRRTASSTGTATAADVFCLVSVLRLLRARPDALRVGRPRLREHGIVVSPPRQLTPIVAAGPVGCPRADASRPPARGP